MVDSLKEFTEKRLATLERNPFDAAKRAGLERTFIRDILIGRKQSVLGRNLAKLAVALDTTEQEIATVLRGGAMPPRARHQEVVAAGVTLPQAMPRDVPVYGTAVAGVTAKAKGIAFEGFTLDLSKVIDHVRRPPGLAAASDAYAIYVAGDSMAPMHSAGELRFVHPHRPARPGDTVLLQVRSHSEAPVDAFIKILVGRTGEAIVVRQLNPLATMQFKASTVVALHRVLTLNELFEV